MNFGYRRMYIDGDLCDAADSARHEQVCPGTEEPIAELAWAGIEDAERALTAAERAFRAWSAKPLSERAEWMFRLRAAILERSDELRNAVMHEMGKPWDATAEDLQSLVDSLEYYPRVAEELKETEIADNDPTFEHRMVTRPVGVVVAILAWNFPLLNIGFKLGPALASGCTIVVKPSERSALSAYLLGEIAASINFPPGVINILCGDPKITGKALSSSSVPRLLTMIGSSAVGRLVVGQGASTIKRMSMELGGNAPAMVFADSDIEGSARAIAAIKFGNAGQICVSPNRIFVQEEVLPRFVACLKREAEKVCIGWGKESGATMGPMISDSARKRVRELIADAVSEGARVICGGGIPGEKGFFLEPTVLDGVTCSMKISRQEVFGPVASVHSFQSEEEVLRKANDTEYGLVAYIWTGSEERAERMASNLEFGEVMVNGYRWAIHLPHGGIGESGIGKDCSVLALEDYVVRVRVTTRRMAVNS